MSRPFEPDCASINSRSTVGAACPPRPTTSLSDLQAANADARTAADDVLNIAARISAQLGIQIEDKVATLGKPVSDERLEYVKDFVSETTDVLHRAFSLLNTVANRLE